MKITFTKEKETKNTIRYKETHHDAEAIVPENVVIGTLYVTKMVAANREKIVIDFPVDGE